MATYFGLNLVAMYMKYTFMRHPKLWRVMGNSKIGWKEHMAMKIVFMVTNRTAHDDEKMSE